MSTTTMDGTKNILRAETSASQLLHSKQTNAVKNTNFSPTESVPSIPSEGFRLLPANFHKNPVSTSAEKSLTEMGFTNDVGDWESIVQPQKENLYYLLRNMILNHVKTNVEVQIGDTSFDCHMMVLQCYSDLFFLECTVESLVQLSQERIAPDAFRLAYNWMIADRPLVQRESILELLAAAKYLHMKGLMEQCRLCMADAVHFQESNAFMFFWESKKYEMEDEGIKEMMLGRISKFFLTVVASEEFLHMTAEEICLLLTSDSIAINTEIEVFLAAVRWLLHDWPERQKFLLKIVQCVRFSLFPPWFLMTLTKKCEPIMADIVGQSAVIKQIQDAVSYNTATICYGSNTPQFEKILKHYDLVAPKQRVWIYDEKCEYHKLPGEDDMGSINYKKFEEYLAVIRTMGPEHWQSLRPYECLGAAEKSKMTFKSSYNQGVQVRNAAAEEQLESRLLSARIQVKESHDGKKKESCHSYYCQENYMSSSGSQVPKDGGHTSADAGSKAQYVSTEQDIVIEAFYSQRQCKKNQPTRTTENLPANPKTSRLEKANERPQQADARKPIDCKPLAPASSSKVRSAKPTCSQLVDHHEKLNKEQPVNQKVSVKINHIKTCPKYSHALKQKHKAISKYTREEPKIEPSNDSVARFDAQKDEPKASSSNAVHSTECSKYGTPHRVRRNFQAKPANGVKSEMPSTNTTFERTPTHIEKKTGFVDAKKQIGTSQDAEQQKPSTGVKKPTPKSSISVKTPSASLRNPIRPAHNEDTNQSNALKKEKKQAMKQATEPVPEITKSRDMPPAVIDTTAENPIAPLAHTQAQTAQQVFGHTQSKPTLHVSQWSKPAPEESNANEQRSAFAQKFSASLHEAKILENGEIHQEAYERHMAFSKRENTVGVVSTSRAQKLNEPTTGQQPENLAVIYKNEVKKFEPQMSGFCSEGPFSDYEINFGVPAALKIQEQQYRASCLAGTLAFPETLTMKQNSPLTSNQLFLTAPQIISSMHNALPSQFRQDFKLPAQTIDASKSATIKNTSYVSDIEVNFHDTSPNEEDRRFTTTQQSQSDTVVMRSDEQSRTNMPIPPSQHDLQCPAHRVSQEHHDPNCPLTRPKTCLNMQHKQDCAGTLKSSGNVSEQSTEQSESATLHGQSVPYAVASYFRTTRHPIVIIFGGIDPYGMCTVHLDKCPEYIKRNERREKSEASRELRTEESKGTVNYGEQVLFYNISSAKWQHLSFIPFGSRHHHATVTVRGQIYVIGGTRTSMECSKKSMFEKSIWCFNPRNLKWTLETSLPEARRDFVAIPIENQCPDCKSGVHCCGLGPGFFVIGGEGVNYTALDTVWFYNVLRKKWTKKASLNLGRYGFAAALVNNEIWIAGGMVGEKANSPHDSSEEKPEKIGDGPEGNSIKATSVTMDKITSTMECYSLQYGACCKREYRGENEICFNCIKDCEGHWTKLDSKLRVPCLFGKLCKVSNKELYLFGGITYDAKQSLVSLRNVDKYDFKAKKWKPCSTLQHARHGHDVVALKDRVLVIGGVSTFSLKTLTQVETFSIKSNTHLKQTADLPWPLSGVTGVTWNM